VLRGETFEAGKYTIERTPKTSDEPSLLIIRGEGETMIFDTMVANSTKNAENTKLVFDNIDGVNYLTSIIVKGQSVKNEIARTAAQKRAIANGTAVTHTVTIANTGF